MSAGLKARPSASDRIVLVACGESHVRIVPVGLFQARSPFSRRGCAATSHAWSGGQQRARRDRQRKLRRRLFWRRHLRTRFSRERLSPRPRKGLTVRCGRSPHEKVLEVGAISPRRQTIRQRTRKWLLSEDSWQPDRPTTCKAPPLYTSGESSRCAWAPFCGAASAAWCLALRSTSSPQRSNRSC
jgi:hypothetical protein